MKSTYSWYLSRSDSGYTDHRPGNSGVSWYPSSQNIIEPAKYFKEFSVYGPLFNILLTRSKFLQIFFDISADLTVYSADLPIFSADLLIISAKFS